MADTYCGKICAECTQKEMLNCPGCKAGPGRQYGGDCELAKCCRDKGHEVCDTCGFKGNCGTLRSRDSRPDYRKRKIEAEIRQKQAVAKRAPFLGKWLWILFWLVIPATIAGLMENNVVAESAPRVFWTGRVMTAVCSLAYGIILLKMSAEEGRYRTAGICDLVCAGISLLVAIVTGGTEGVTWTLILTIPAAIVGFVGEYNEYMAHSAVLISVDNDLSSKWEKLWKWYIGLFLGMFGCIIVMLISPLLGALAVLGAAIGVAVVSILKLVHLYRTAKVFREYQPDVLSPAG